MSAVNIFINLPLNIGVDDLLWDLPEVPQGVTSLIPDLPSSDSTPADGLELDLDLDVPGDGLVAASATIGEGLVSGSEALGSGLEATSEVLGDGLADFGEALGGLFDFLGDLDFGLDFFLDF